MKKTGRWWKRFGKKKIILSAVLIAGTGLALSGFYSLRNMRGGRAIAREMSVQETQAKTGTISDTIVGTGNLEYEEAGSITIPSGVVIDEVKVDAGDAVSKGDVLAVVNEASLFRAMESIQEEIDALDEDIEETRDDTDSQSVKSRVDGRVKRIYVQKEQEISDCMVEQGALMLLSLDGYLAVDIQTEAEISKGDNVVLTRPDGTEEEGTVETVEDGKAVVLCTDSGVGIEEQVAVTDSEGNALGNGTTYIHKQLAITATTGTVEEICVSEDEKVYAGTTLLTLDGEEQSLEYQEQMATREKLAESLQEMIALSQNGVITAESDGIIKTVNISANSSTSETGDVQISQNETAVVKSTQASQDIQVSENVAASEEALAFKIMDSGTADRDCLVIESPQTGKTPQTTLCAEDGSYEGLVSWKPKDQQFAAETSYQANVTLTAKDGYLFDGDSIVQVQTGVLSGVDVAKDGKRLSFCITYPFTSSEKTDSRNENGNETGTGNETGNEKENETGNKTGTESENKTGNKTGTETENKTGAEKENETGNKTGTEKENETGNKAGTDSENKTGTGSVTGTGTQKTAATKSAGAASVASADTSASQTDSSAEAADSDEEVVAFTLSSADAMILSVNVDELDINSVSEEQQAEVTLDAIEDETFTGTVIKVGNSADSAGGVAKYEVELKIPGDERMKEGMNASATITVEERENVVTIPVNALQERGSRVFVYTQTDEEGNLSGEKEVTTGLSDGETVEIAEGLSEGETVYYQKTGNLSGQGSFQGFDQMGGGPGGDMPDGEMPGGGQMTGGKMSDGQKNGGGMRGGQQ